MSFPRIRGGEPYYSPAAFDEFHKFGINDVNSVGAFNSETEFDDLSFISNSLFGTKRFPATGPNDSDSNGYGPFESVGPNLVQFHSWNGPDGGA